ncbi:MAG: AI-2E family transporter [Anaerolineales bacterium]|nr:AI-2E family transporter [Anaerolineales bacterium]MCB0017379.1 AI-2E family transporter [Anaerolineales bacterium]
MRLSTSLVLLLLGLAAGLGLLLFAWPLWASLLIALLLTSLLSPLVEVGERRWPERRRLLASLVYLLTLLLIVGLILLLGALIWDRVPLWSQELGDALHEMRLWLEKPLNILGFSLNPQALLDYLERTAGNALTTIPIGSADFIGGVTDNLIWTIVVLVALFYFLRDGPAWRRGLQSRIPDSYRDEAVGLIEEISEVWRVFLRVQLLIFLILGLLILASTTLIIWLYRTGSLSLSPFGLIVLLIAVYAAIQQVDNLWLRPRYMGQTLELHAGVVIISLLAALVLTGVLGALLIVPLLATVKVLALHFYEKHYGLPDPLPPHPLAEETDSPGQSETS